LPFIINYMLETEADAFLADPVLAETLRKVIEVDYKIDGLNAELVERLEHYQKRYIELRSKVV